MPTGRARPRSRSPRFLGALVVFAATAVLSACAPQAPQGPKPRSDPFGNLNGPGYNNWHGDFPDGMVMWDPSTGKYYGYSTPTGGVDLPIIWSTDLATWHTREVYHPPDQPYPDGWFNDGMVKAASWAWDAPAWDGLSMRKKTWAPHVTKFGSTYVDFYSVALSDGDGNPNTWEDEKWCISYATSTSPLGPFRDTTTGPLVCGDRPPPGFNHEPSTNPKGSIDPSVTFDENGNAFLLWRNSGAPMNGSATRIMVRQLAATKTNWAPGFSTNSSTRELLATLNNSWMGHQIENPAMIRYGGKWWLFYSGGYFNDASYAIGFAVCEFATGPCAHITTGSALLSSYNTPHWGPGGGTPFLDAGGGLRLSYHYWANNNPGYEYRPDGVWGMRPMTVATLVQGPFGFAVTATG